MAEAKARIYKVTQVINGLKTVRLIRAQNNVQAESFVARKTITAELPTQDELITMSKNNIPIVDARTADNLDLELEDKKATA